MLDIASVLGTTAAGEDGDGFIPNIGTEDGFSSERKSQNTLSPKSKSASRGMQTSPAVGARWVKSSGSSLSTKKLTEKIPLINKGFYAEICWYLVQIKFYPHLLTDILIYTYINQY